MITSYHQFLPSNCSLKYLFMLKLSAKKLNYLLEAPSQKNRERAKMLSRKPEIGSFSRKMNEQVLVTDSISTIRSSSRQKCKSEIGLLLTSTSLKNLKPPEGPQIKFLSPKNMKDVKLSECSQFGHNQKSPRFTRTTHVDSKKLLNLSVLSKISEHQIEDNLVPISHLSPDSVWRKETSQSMPNSEDWSFLDRENCKLREENERLKKQNSWHIIKIRELSDQIVTLTSNKKKPQFFQKCKNCPYLQQKIIMQSKHISLYEAAIVQKQKQIEQVKSSLYKLKVENQNERYKYVHLHEEFRRVSTKQLEEEKIKLELVSIIDSLNQKLESHEQQVKYYGIQQSILMKKKHQNEQWKAEAASWTSEKQSLKKMVSIYKQKLDVIRQINKKNKLKKSKSSRDLYYEDLFELSSEQSDGTA